MGERTNRKAIAIIGGGAAGLAAAVAAGEHLKTWGVDADVVVFEHDDRVGRSILATGNGRCNFSNESIDSSLYYNEEFVDQVMWSLASISSFDDQLPVGKPSGYPSDPVHEFFYTHGLTWHEESDGRLFPGTNKASTVLDILRASAANVGVREACNQTVVAVEPPRGPGKPFTLRMADGVFERADCVIVAVGGKPLSTLSVADMTPSRTRPVLGPLRTETEYVVELDNIRVPCKVTLARECLDEIADIATEKGELLFRKYGVSGICVFNLSRFAWAGDILYLDFLQVGDQSDVKWFLRHRRAMLEQVFGTGFTFGDLLRGLVLPRVADVILKRCGLKATDRYDETKMPAVASMLVEFPLKVKGIGDADRCQVHRGGYAVEDIDFQTMQVLRIPGLFMAGEALDVDGPCGGYNLHWAWASGLLAGRSAAAYLSDND